MKNMHRLLISLLAFPLFSGLLISNIAKSRADDSVEAITISSLKQATPFAFDPEQFIFEEEGEFLSGIPDWRSRTDYAYTLIDLNNDQVDEIVIAVYSPTCGVWECSAYVLRWNGARYTKIGSIGIASYGGHVNTLSSQTNGMTDLVGVTYAGGEDWALYRFNGSRYQYTDIYVEPGSGPIVVRNPREF